MAEYVDPYSVSSVQKGIETALNKSKSSELSKHIKDNYLWDNIAYKTKAVYEEVLDRSR